MKDAFLLAAVLLLAACDSSPALEDPPLVERPSECPGDVVLTKAPRDTSLYAGATAAWLRLPGSFLAFEHTAEQPLTYSLHSSNEEVATARLENGYVVISPLSTGQARISVLAQDACQHMGEARFSVQVLDACPPALAPGEVDYFPLEIGQRWTFERTYQVHTVPTWRHVGILTWRVEQAMCEAGARLFHITEQFEGTEQITYDGTTWQDAEPVSQRRTLTFTQRADSLILEAYAFEPFRWHYPATTPDTVEVSQTSGCSSHRPCSVQLKLVRGEGVVQRHFIDHPSADWYVTDDEVRIEN